MTKFTTMEFLVTVTQDISPIYLPTINNKLILLLIHFSHVMGSNR